MRFIKTIKKYYFDPGYRAIFLFNLSQKFRRRGLRRCANFLLFWCRKKTGVEFNSRCIIGKGLKIAHAQNIVIGGNSRIGDRVTIYNGVTLGVSGRMVEDDGFYRQEPGYPTIEDDCIIYSGAKILGAVVIGENSIIGANAVVMQDVPKSSVVAGVPAKVIKSNTIDLKKYR